MGLGFQPSYLECFRESHLVRSALEDEVIPTVWEFVPSKQDFDAFPDKTSM